MSARRLVLIPCVLISLLVAAAFADDSAVVLLWPDKTRPTLKLTFQHFRTEGGDAGQSTFISEVIIQNLSANPTPHAYLTVNLLDKDHIRIGSGLLSMGDLAPGESAKLPFQCLSMGMPTALSISTTNSGGLPMPPKSISMRVISEPPGARLKVDGKDLGLTPATISMAVGSHNLELQKEGYALTTTPFDVAPDETAGGSINVTLGGLSNDEVILRDGTTLSGDVISMSLESITIRVDGKERKLDRNLVAKMFLVERIITQPASAKSGKPTSTASPASHE
jgi:hypothetical protein